MKRVVYYEDLVKQIELNACDYYLSDYPKEYNSTQIIESIWNESDSVIIWEGVEHLDRDEVVNMIEILRDDLMKYIMEYNKVIIMNQPEKRKK